MSIKWLGVIFVIGSCAGVGFSAAMAYETQEKTLYQLMRILDCMSCELQYKLLPLPELCRQASGECGGTVRRVLSALAGELERQMEPDVQSCMRIVLEKERMPARRIRRLFLMLGHSLGNFDLTGQLRGLEEVRTACERELTPLAQQKQNAIRSYRTLGICAGIAIAILLL